MRKFMIMPGGRPKLDKHSKKNGFEKSRWPTKAEDNTSPELRGTTRNFHNQGTKPIWPPLAAACFHKNMATVHTMDGTRISL